MSVFLLSFTHLLTLLNPFGVLPLFLTMTHGLDRREIFMIALKACVTAVICLVSLAFGGKYLFEFFGISIDGLKVVGGILFMITGYDMLQARVSRIKDHDEKEFKKLGASAAITPLAIPMISGPGAITATMVMMEESKGITDQISTFAAIVAAISITFLVLIGSKRIIHFLGDSGTKVFLRLMGLILMMIAVEFFFSGVTPYMKKILGT